MSEHSHAASHEHHVISLTTYIVVFAALMVLLVATIAVTYVDLGIWNVIIALSIAVAKAALIVLYFMHIRFSDGMTRLFAAMGFLWFGLMIVIALGDYMTRGMDQGVVRPTALGMQERLSERLPSAQNLVTPAPEPHDGH